MSIKLLPSIASANQLSLKGELDRISDWPYLHIDIEDGNFVPNISFGLKTLSAICEYAKEKIIDVHLMTMHPLQWLEHFDWGNVRRVAAHIEALPYPMIFINRAHSLGMKAGLALNIKTAATETEAFWEIADYLLVMTSEPDLSGEKLYKPALNKAIALVKRLHEGPELYVDGGLTQQAVRDLNKAGAAGAVVGRIIFSAKDPLQMLNDLSLDND